MKLTPAQRRVLEYLARRSYPAACAEVARAVYADNFKLREYRTHPRGVNHSGIKGGLGNLAVGRTMARLWKAGLVRGMNTYEITDAGRDALKETP